MNTTNKNKTEEIELDCHMSFGYDEDYDEVVFAHADLSVCIPRSISEQFKAVPYQEWDKLFIDVINKIIKDGEYYRYKDVNSLLEDKDQRIEELNQEVEMYRERLGLRNNYKGVIN